MALAHALAFDRRLRFLRTVSKAVDTINGFVGRQVSWLILAAVLVSAGNATVRKAFDMSSNMWLELQWYLFGTVFMLAAAYTLMMNEHIRIDVLSSLFSKRTRDLIEFFGHIFFLFPFVLVMVWLCVPWFIRSFQSGESSANAGGLIIWPAKFMVLAGFVLLVLQAYSEIIKRMAVIAKIIEDPATGQSLPRDTEADATALKNRDD